MKKKLINSCLAQMTEFTKEFAKFLTCDEKPDFQSLPENLIRILAQEQGYSEDLPIPCCLMILEKTWVVKKNARSKELNELKRKLVNYECKEEPCECPVCLESIETNNYTMTKCGHKLCLPCFVEVLPSNSCPMCRQELVLKKNLRQ